MFGVDPAKLAHKSKKKRRWIVAVELLTLITGLAIYAFLYTFATQDGLQRVLHRIVGDAPVEVAFDEVNIVPWSQILEPSTWKLSIAGLEFRSKDPEGPDVEIARVILSVPDVVRAWAKREIAFQEMRATAPTIHIKRQRQPRGFSATRSALSSIQAERIQISDARVRVDPDPPLDRVDATGIAGNLDRFRYHPATQELHTEGHLDASSYQTGHLRLTRVSIKKITADGTDVSFSGGSFRVAGGRGRVSGTIHSLAHNPSADFRIHLDGARFGDLLRSSSKRRIPLEGTLTADLHLRAGGTLPKAKGIFSGKVTLDDARLDLGKRFKPGWVDLIRSMPFTHFDEKNQLTLPQIQGDVVFHRGHTDLSDVTFTAGKRAVSLEVHTTPEQFSAFMHFVPERDKDPNRILGLAIYAQGKKTRLKIQRKGVYQAGGDAGLDHENGDDAEDEDADKGTEDGESPRRKHFNFRPFKKREPEAASEGDESGSAADSRNERPAPVDPSPDARPIREWLRRKERRNEQTSVPPSHEH